MNDIQVKKTDSINKNIVLIGMPGCGKTTLGKLLAEKLGRKLTDIDHYIEEKEGCAINDIFEYGEEAFRNIETKAVLDLEEEEASVIATGGGVVKRASNMDSLKKNGIIVYIDRSIKDIAIDIDIRTRPLLANSIERLTELYFERHDLYRRYSDLTVKNEGKITEVVENIKKEIFERAI